MSGEMQVAGNSDSGRLVSELNSAETGDRHFGALFRAAGIGIALCTMDGDILDCNLALSNVLGMRREELTGRRFWNLRSDDCADPEPLLEQLRHDERQVFKLNEVYNGKDGSQVSGCWTISATRNEEAEPKFLIAVFEDTSQHKHEAEQLREAEKMEVIGRLAGGIAHDFNNLLTGILLYCDLLSAGLEHSCRLRQHVEEIRLAGEQGAALTQQLLTVARKQIPHVQPVLLNEVVSSTRDLLRRLIGEQIELAVVLEPTVGAVLADPAQLRQILLNLVLNSRDAMPNGGQITVSTANRTMREGAQSSVLLRIEDNGCGMDVETRSRVFEPFFTTKKAGHGTGLGLATVQRIVGELNGTIEIESEPRRGTRIDVLLPALDLTRAQEERVARPRTGGTILLVDDHFSARHSMQRVLQHAGYRVLAAASGKRALRVFSEHVGEIDLLITDSLMPGMSGPELAHKLHREKPELKVLLISGYHAHEETGASSIKFIHKPFSGPVLIERIREVLDCKEEGLPC